ncbi:hypothetical protein [Burkholderia phage vB_BpP_HN04]|nr:hypothetical protein [Burkholderia phage vB_BpP_HN01]
MNMYVHGENGSTFVGPMIYSLCDWRALVRSKAIVPNDGMGFWIIGGKVSEISCFDPMPENATGVEWHNR